MNFNDYAGDYMLEAEKKLPWGVDGKRRITKRIPTTSHR
jgi:hypothetical protein